MGRISRKEIIEMLEIKNGSKAFFDLLSRSYDMSKAAYGGKGYIFAQIGLNAEPCPVNCKFCSFADKYFSVNESSRRTKSEILEEAKQFFDGRVSHLFLMTTADYPIELFIDVVKEVRKAAPKNVRLIGNIGDFDSAIALRLKEAGLSGFYHICRLNEGIDTEVSLETRIHTIEAIKEQNLELLYCIEPIGPEHTYAQIADEIERAIHYQVEVMAIMRRVPVLGTPLYDKGAIDSLEFAKIAAVTRIAVDPKKSMNAHETNYMTLLAGVNQLYAETGANPRDQSATTQISRGLSVTNCQAILKEVGYQVGISEMEA
ncbi:MAG: radical SAM protein [Anaerovorax sp.]